MTSARNTRIIVSAAFLALATLVGAVPAAAQAALSAVQPLDFGTLLPGLSETVTVQDAWRRAEVKITGAGNFDLRLILPTALTSRDGARIPLVFRSGDGAIQAKNGKLTPFDPNVTERFKIPPGHGEATLLVGGTAATTAAQRAGEYTATVVVVLSSTDT